MREEKNTWEWGKSLGNPYGADDTSTGEGREENLTKELETLDLLSGRQERIPDLKEEDVDIATEPDPDLDEQSPAILFHTRTPSGEIVTKEHDNRPDDEDSSDSETKV